MSPQDSRRNRSVAWAWGSKRKYATMKWKLSLRYERHKEKGRLKPKKERKEKKILVHQKKEKSLNILSVKFLQYNPYLGSLYHILVYTKFINFSIRVLVQSEMDCLYAKCAPCSTDCAMTEIEALGQKCGVVLESPRLHDLADSCAYTKEPVLMTAWYR